MLGLVLEGGGAKGSYHAGVIKALYENGYRFDGVAGTSIGAINGALIAQGDYELCYKMWQDIHPSDFIDVNDELINRILTKETNVDSWVYLFRLVKKALGNKGLSTEKIVPFLKKVIDEERLRASNTDYCIVTVSLSDKKPLELFKEDIPSGSLHDYILASAYFPAFRINPIEGKRYIDGGIFDNLPINPLIRKGYDNIIAVRTMSKMPHRPIFDDTVKIDYIHPYESLGGTMEVSKSSIERNLKRGYLDGLRFIKGYIGEKYYFYSVEEEKIGEYLSKLSENIISKLAELLNLKNEDDREYVIKEMMKAIRKYQKSYVVNDSLCLLNFFENKAKELHIEQFCLYTFETFLNLLREEYEKSSKDLKSGGLFRRTKERIFEILISEPN